MWFVSAYRKIPEVITFCEVDFGFFLNALNLHDLSYAEVKLEICCGVDAVSAESRGCVCLVGILDTDSSGRTDPIAVETVNRSLSQEPGEQGNTFTTYYVSARKSGYFPIDKYPVDVFGGQTSILELGFTPQPEYLGWGR